MKKIYTILGLTSALFIFGCSKDIGNYDYAPGEVITINGIEDSYTKIAAVDKITLDPEVSSTEKDADFECFWGVYDSRVLGTLVIDTIAKTKAIDYLISQSPKDWTLVFGAKNKKTGVSKYVISTLKVGTQFTRGWYVLKDDGSQTDLDLFKSSVGIVPVDKVENVYSIINGKKLNGKASLFSFQYNYRTNPTGVYANYRALYLMSDKDVSVVDISSLKELNDFNHLFYEAPATKAPSIVTWGYLGGNYVVNDGQLHSLYANLATNTGHFGARRIKDGVNTPYKLSKYFMMGSGIQQNPIFFDEMSSSFVSCVANSTVLNLLTDGTGNKIPVNNNNKNLLFMGTKSGSPYTGYAILQDKSNPSIKILSSLTPVSPKLTITASDTMKVTDKIYNASNYTLNLDDENMIYFTVGNEVWSRNLSNKFEQRQFIAPAGEEITFIRHRKYAGTASGEAPFKYNYIMIGTKIGANYKVRMFTKTSGNLSPDPAVTLDGKGSVGDVIYISPVNSTYLNNY
ncbi:PKD-like family lipoprotein [Solitalea koreensis]|uniref:PKD-like family protein n=1 Tax=Solitalea koreensis TaxID=543615 RepID=A0A521AVE5_9SPHI|nr:PKD-like family lipoprotein [Solitalea koreensis]SMO38787.1 PKD-like family protein [Solitalea koreensis]